MFQASLFIYGAISSVPGQKTISTVLLFTFHHDTINKLSTNSFPEMLLLPDKSTYSSRVGPCIQGCITSAMPSYLFTCAFAHTLGIWIYLGILTHVEFWQKKFDDNVRRDAVAAEALQASHVKCLIVWECTIKRMMKDAQYESQILEQCLRFIHSDCDRLEL